MEMVTCIVFVVLYFVINCILLQYIGSDIVNRSGKLLEKGHRGALKSGKIDIQRVSDANIASSSSDSISGRILLLSTFCRDNNTLNFSLVVKFSKSNNLLLSGGEDKHLRLFKIDGDRNDLQLGSRSYFFSLCLPYF